MGSPAGGADDFDVGQLRDVEVLAARAGTGDQDALGALMSRVRPLVQRYCSARLRPDTSPRSRESAVQEVCRALISELPHYRCDGPTFLSLLYRVASREVADADRGDPTADRHVDAGDHAPQHAAGAAEPAHVSPDTALADRMHRLLDRLPRGQQAILVLRVSGGFSAPETARLLGSTPGAVRVAQHRALCSLREMLGGDVGDVAESPPPGRGGAAPAPSGSTTDPSSSPRAS